MTITVHEKLKHYLEDHGLFPKEADAVMATVTANPANAAIKFRWNDSSEGYPPELFAALASTANAAAIQWIDANKPLHWARPVFAGRTTVPVPASG